MVAIIYHEAPDRISILFEFRDSDGRYISSIPRILIPAESYDHALAVVKAFNQEA